MVNAFALLLMLASGFDAGVHITTAGPSGSLTRFHSSAAMLGATAGWSGGRFRIAANYDYTSLPGRAALPYRLNIQLARAELGTALINRPGWNLALLTGGGIAYGNRSYHAGSETATTPCAHWGVGFAQLSGRSRLSAGFIHTMLANNPADRSPGFDHLIGLRVGVSYAP